MEAPTASNVSSTLNGLNRKGKDLMDQATEKVQSKAESLDLQSYYTAAKEGAQDAIEASEGFVKKYPFYTVLGAVAVGFLAGYVSKRRH